MLAGSWVGSVIQPALRLVEPLDLREQSLSLPLSSSLALEICVVAVAERTVCVGLVVGSPTLGSSNTFFVSPVSGTHVLKLGRGGENCRRGAAARRVSSIASFLSWDSITRSASASRSNCAEGLSGAELERM